MSLSIDFETRSRVDLIKRGAYLYATDPSTHVYTMSWAFDDEPVASWIPGEPFPGRVKDHMAAGGNIVAWNCQFERLIFWYVLCPDFDLPEPPLEAFQCTAARARAHGLPGKLGDCAKALGTSSQKMEEGARLIKAYSIPNAPWEKIPAADQQAFRDYCDDDVDTERDIGRLLRKLSAEEQYEFAINEHVNDRGVPLDLEFVQHATLYCDEVRDDADNKIKELTGGVVCTARERKSRDAWVLPQLSEEGKTILTNGKKISFEERRRNALMVHPETPYPVMQYLTMVEESGGASMRKYQAMADKQIDGRMNGALMWNGAGQTGRFSSKGIQLHNLNRQTVDNPEQYIDIIKQDGAVDNPHKVLTRLVRSAIYSEGGLSWFDWSSIEGRVAPWLEGSPLGEAKLALYVKGVDPYIYNASKTFLVPYDEVTKTQRQAGKLMELALQFLGGVGALKVMGVGYGIHITDDQGIQYRDGWRSANPWAVSFGRTLDRAAIKATRQPGRWFEAGRVRYISSGPDWLWCELPSGRLLAYNKPRLEQVKTPWGDMKLAVTCLWGASKPTFGAPWPRRAMHGGIWLENITQGTAADLLREAVIRVDDAGLDIVLHCHDEIVVEGYCLEQLGEIMLQPPSWSGGLPLAGEGTTGERYGSH